MNNSRNLYIVIGVLILLNIATVSLFFGWKLFGFRSPLSSWMMQNSQSHMGIGKFNSWEDMEKHMRDEHEYEEEKHAEAENDAPFAETHKSTFDFGKIKKSDGIVTTTFEIENHGREKLVLGDISTSCACTRAAVNKTEIPYNEKASLIVKFDPNIHEEPEGKFKRSIFVDTNDTQLPQMQFDIYIELID